MSLGWSNLGAWAASSGVGGNAWARATEERAAVSSGRSKLGARAARLGVGSGTRARATEERTAASSGVGGPGGGTRDGEARGDISTGLSPPLLTTPLPPPPPPPLPFSDLAWRGFAALVARRRWWRPTGLCSSVVEAEAVEAAAGLDTGGVEAEAVEADGAR
ncbi:hypothetical protein OsJ_34526 [Oryza sativa Japonica Group]|uniref:Uncharacterized protein n=1 Tax=Oryza sativa subsp. japonica TaxID=39947 RepID=B9G8E9_ORYSJ|nr:hypothetical protein OsJ_34526 [Oryza sativa Japonica Group]